MPALLYDSLSKITLCDMIPGNYKTCMAYLDLLSLQLVLNTLDSNSSLLTCNHMVKINSLFMLLHCVINYKDFRLIVPISHVMLVLGNRCAIIWYLNANCRI
jgi:hypothetical protein